MELIEIILICLILYCICSKCLKKKESFFINPAKNVAATIAAIRKKAEKDKKAEEDKKAAKEMADKILANHNQIMDNLEPLLHEKMFYQKQNLI